MKKINPSSNSRDSNFEREQYLYLTTSGRRSGMRREIEIWFTQRGNFFYVIAEYATSHWVKNLLANPSVQVRVGGENFDARARVVPHDEELRTLVQQLSREKYGWGDGEVVEIQPQRDS